MLTRLQDMGRLKGSKEAALLLASLFAAPVWTAAQALTATERASPSPEARMLAARRALRNPAVPVAELDRAQRPAGWDYVQGLQHGDEVRVTLTAGEDVVGRFVSADQAGLVLVPGGQGAARTILRDDVAVVAARGPSRGSKIGALAGAGIGAFAGFVAALHLGYKDCGGDCSDERVLIGASVVGVPVAAGWLGYRLFARPGDLKTIYRRAP
ncbi:MAG: hypothetical protein IT184_13005 [Acidobacteria bacterium]|nr:hypothetical protein [Acidobacteriota bacterium]